MEDVTKKIYHVIQGLGFGAGLMGWSEGIEFSHVPNDVIGHV